MSTRRAPDVQGRARRGLESSCMCCTVRSEMDEHPDVQVAGKLPKRTFHTAKRNVAQPSHPPLNNACAAHQGHLQPLAVIWYGAQLALDTTLVSPVTRDGRPHDGAHNHPGLAVRNAASRKRRQTRTPTPLSAFARASPTPYICKMRRVSLNCKTILYFFYNNVSVLQLQGSGGLREICSIHAHKHDRGEGGCMLLPDPSIHGRVLVSQGQVAQT